MTGVGTGRVALLLSLLRLGHDLLRRLWPCLRVRRPVGTRSVRWGHRFVRPVPPLVQGVPTPSPRRLWSTRTADHRPVRAGRPPRPGDPKRVQATRSWRPPKPVPVASQRPGPPRIDRRTAPDHEPRPRVRPALQDSPSDRSPPRSPQPGRSLSPTRPVASPASPHRRRSVERVATENGSTTLGSQAALVDSPRPGQRLGCHSSQALPASLLRPPRRSPRIPRGQAM